MVLNILFILNNATKYTEENPPGIVLLITKVNDLKAKMIAAGEEEDFAAAAAAAAAFKAKWEGYYHDAFHAVTDMHKENRDTAKEVQVNLDNTRAKVQQCINEEQLVGSTYTQEQIEAQLLWLSLACKANWSLKSIMDNRVSPFYEPYDLRYLH
jgi:hypothetical protein